MNPEDAVDSIQVAAGKGNNGELSQSRDGMGGETYCVKTLFRISEDVK